MKNDERGGAQTAPKASVADWTAGRAEKWAAHLAAMEATLAPIDEPLFAALHLEGPCRIAEVGSGGGATAWGLARRAPAGSTVRGFDISPRLVELARARHGAGAPPLPRPTFEVADMELAAPDGDYDRLIARFGVMFFRDPPVGFANLARWLTPRGDMTAARAVGRLAFAVWGAPAENRWMTIVREAVARVVDVPSPPPDAPGPFRYADVGTLLDLLARAGFDDLEARVWRGMLPVGGALAPAAAADFGLSAFSSFDELLAAAGDGAREEAHRGLTTLLEPHHRDGAVQLGASVHIVTGTRAP